jgi:hypothetical protein
MLGFIKTSSLTVLLPALHLSTLLGFPPKTTFLLSYRENCSFPLPKSNSVYCMAALRCPFPNIPPNPYQKDIGPVLWSEHVIPKYNSHIYNSLLQRSNKQKLRITPVWACRLRSSFPNIRLPGYCTTTEPYRLPDKPTLQVIMICCSSCSKKMPNPKIK